MVIAREIIEPYPYKGDISKLPLTCDCMCRLRTSSDTLHRSKYGYMSHNVHNKFLYPMAVFITFRENKFDEGEQKCSAFFQTFLTLTEI